MAPNLNRLLRFMMWQSLRRLRAASVRLVWRLHVPATAGGS
jgi:hypothetical protein